MNRYQAMMETLPVPTGQSERLKAAVLAAAPKRRRVLRPWKRALLAAALAVALLATTGAALEAVEWDPALLARFGPSSVPRAEGVFRDVNAVSVCGDVTLTVRQAVGDKKNLYVLLDYQLPEGADLAAVEAAEYLPPILITTRRGRELTWEEIRDMSLEEQRQTYDHTGSVSGQSTHTTGFDPETRTLSCVISANFQEGWNLLEALDPSITLLVWPPEAETEAETEEGEIPLADHAAVITFRPAFDAETATGKVKLEGTAYTAEVSPLSFQARIKGDALPDMRDIATVREMESSLALRLRDGTEISGEDLQLSGGSSSSSASYTRHEGGRLSGRIMLNVVFRELMDPAEVEAVLVGDVEIPVS